MLTNWKFCKVLTGILSVITPEWNTEEQIAIFILYSCEITKFTYHVCWCEYKQPTNQSCGSEELFREHRCQATSRANLLVQNTAYRSQLRKSLVDLRSEYFILHRLWVFMTKGYMLVFIKSNEPLLLRTLHKVRRVDFEPITIDCNVVRTSKNFVNLELLSWFIPETDGGR